MIEIKTDNPYEGASAEEIREIDREAMKHILKQLIYNASVLGLFLMLSMIFQCGWVVLGTLLFIDL